LATALQVVLQLLLAGVMSMSAPEQKTNLCAFASSGISNTIANKISLINIATSPV
jgi:hypothetical protein